MKTTHQIAKELLALPDVLLVVEYWIMQAPSTHEMVAEMTDYDPEGTAIIRQKRIEVKSAEPVRPRASPS
jgi:hypothetical protein